MPFYVYVVDGKMNIGISNRRILIENGAVLIKQDNAFGEIWLKNTEVGAIASVAKFDEKEFLNIRYISNIIGILYAILLFVYHIPKSIGNSVNNSI